MMEEDFSVKYLVRWADLDPNGHVRHTAYSDFAADARMRLVERHGYPASRFLALRFGPVIMREESRYYREVGIGDAISVSFKLAGVSSDGSRWIVQHDMVNSAGEKIARIRVEGTWMNLDSREAIAPPPDLFKIHDRLPRTQNFKELRSLVHRRSG